MMLSPLPPATAHDDASAMLRGALAAINAGRWPSTVRALGARDSKPATFAMADGRRVVVGPDPVRMGSKALIAAAGRSPSAFAPALHALALVAVSSAPGFLEPSVAAVAKLARMSEAALLALAGDGAVPDLEELQMRLDRLVGP